VVTKILAHFESIKEYYEKVECTHPNPVKAGFAGMKGAHIEFRLTQHVWLRLWRAVLQTAHPGQRACLQRPPSVIR
jgi:hypothetical protein